IIYSSQATAPMSVPELEKILVDARAGNEARNVTGALVYVDGVFLQILEGDESTVRGVMRNIAGDTRHTDVKVFHQAEVDARAFGSWRMAYVNATPEQLSAWAGLPGTATIESILSDLDRDPHRASGIARGMLEALAG
ncbi:MAG: BLUF domain-containing protein, partial [Rubrivivax sp.]|nr:BLUF domain-containing protein [Rubrivivax sp.]